MDVVKNDENQECGGWICRTSLTSHLVIYMIYIYLYQVFTGFFAADTWPLDPQGCPFSGVTSAYASPSPSRLGRKPPQPRCFGRRKRCSASMKRCLADAACSMISDFANSPWGISCYLAVIIYYNIVCVCLCEHVSFCHADILRGQCCVL